MCASCLNVMTISFVKTHKEDDTVSFIYENDNCIKFYIFGEIYPLVINTKNNLYSLPNSKITVSNLSRLLSDKNIFIRLFCNNCNLQINSFPLSFMPNEFINDIVTRSLTLETEINNRKIIISNYYDSQETYIIKESNTSPISYQYLNFPLVDFDLYNKENLFYKINTLINFS